MKVTPTPPQEATVTIELTMKEAQYLRETHYNIGGRGGGRLFWDALDLALEKVGVKKSYSHEMVDEDLPHSIYFIK